MNGNGNGGHCVVSKSCDKNLLLTANFGPSSADAGLRSRAQVPTINIGCVKLREYLFLKFGLLHALCSAVCLCRCCMGGICCHSKVMSNVKVENVKKISPIQKQKERI